MLDLTTGAVLFCAITGLMFLGLWMWYDRRDHASFDAECRRTTFHCIRCGHLYSARRGPETSPCPKCGHENAHLKF
jgi:rubredoxin